MIVTLDIHTDHRTDLGALVNRLREIAKDLVNDPRGSEYNVGVVAVNVVGVDFSVSKENRS